jgi:integrase
VLGDTDLSKVGNKALANLISGLSLAPATIQRVEYVVKAVVKSATNDEGDALYPVRWNSTVIDAPTVEDQNAPELPLETLQKALEGTSGRDKVLVALLAGSGLRIAEALELRAEDDGEHNFFDRSKGALSIRNSKTDAGVRTVDLHPDLVNFLAANLPEDGALFPACGNTYARHIKAAAGFSDFHRFRRFRITHLRSKRTQESLLKAWAGHAKESTTDRYDHTASDNEFRKTEVQRVGLGFSLGA